MTQAGISTILCLCVLGVIQAYMVKVFVKVVIIVVILGLLHGLIILPVVFGAIPLRKRIITDVENNKVSTTNSTLQKVRLLLLLQLFFILLFSYH